MNRQRRFAFFAAANVATRRVDIPRPEREEWSYDDRLSPQHQVGNELYSRSPFDRSRLIKRLQPAWGGKRIAIRAAALTNHFTNTIPLISQLNRNLLWISLPDHILATYAQDERMVMLAGPVFQNQDPVFRSIQIPCACWRIAVFITRGGPPMSLGFLATQDL